MKTGTKKLVPARRIARCAFCGESRTTLTFARRRWHKRCVDRVLLAAAAGTAIPWPADNRSKP